MRHICYGLALSILGSALVANAHAEEITFRASGPVTWVIDPTLRGALANPVSVGDEMRVSYTFESTVDAELSPNNMATYRSAIKSIRIEVSGNDLTLAPCDANCNRRIVVGDDAWQDPGYVDQYYVAASTSADLPTLLFDMVLTRYADSTPIPVLTSTKLPLTPPNPDDFPDAGMFLRYVYPDGAGAAAVDISANVTALETVSSKTAEERLVDLAQMVVEMNVQAGISNALDAKLENAIAALDKAKEGDRSMPTYLLEAFINEVNAQRDKKLTDLQADQLVAAARAIIEQLSQP